MVPVGPWTCEFRVIVSDDDDDGDDEIIDDDNVPEYEEPRPKKRSQRDSEDEDAPKKKKKKLNTRKRRERQRLQAAALLQAKEASTFAGEPSSHEKSQDLRGPKKRKRGRRNPYRASNARVLKQLERMSLSGSDQPTSRTTQSPALRCQAARTSSQFPATPAAPTHDL